MVAVSTLPADRHFFKDSPGGRALAKIVLELCHGELTDSSFLALNGRFIGGERQWHLHGLAKLAERYADQPKEHSSNKRRSAFASIEWPSQATTSNSRRAGVRVARGRVLQRPPRPAVCARLSARDYILAGKRDFRQAKGYLPHWLLLQLEGHKEHLLSEKVPQPQLVQLERGRGYGMARFESHPSDAAFVGGKDGGEGNEIFIYHCFLRQSEKVK